jgi:hypothetical protein
MKGCRNCSRWQALEEFLDRIDPATQDKKAQLGLCKRYAPRSLTPEAGAGAVGGAVGGGMGGAEPRWRAFWPHVASDDWCGEWDPQFD